MCSISSCCSSHGWQYGLGDGPVLSCRWPGSKEAVSVSRLQFLLHTKLRLGAEETKAFRQNAESCT